MQELVLMHQVGVSAGQIGLPWVTVTGRFCCVALRVGESLVTVPEISGPE